MKEYEPKPKVNSAVAETVCKYFDTVDKLVNKAKDLASIGTNVGYSVVEKMTKTTPGTIAEDALTGLVIAARVPYIAIGAAAQAQQLIFLPAHLKNKHETYVEEGASNPTLETAKDAVDAVKGCLESIVGSTNLLG